MTLHTKLGVEKVTSRNSNATNKRRVLEAELTRAQEAWASAQQQLQLALLREQILVDLVDTQHQVQVIMQKQYVWMLSPQETAEGAATAEPVDSNIPAATTAAAEGGAHPLCHPASQHCASAGAASGSAAGSSLARHRDLYPCQPEQKQQSNETTHVGLVARVNYFIDRLSAATPQQLLQALAMTTANWIQKYKHLFVELAVLVELSSRVGVSACAVEDAGNGSGSTCRDSSSFVAADGGAAAAPSGDSNSSSSCEPHHEAQQRLEECVDETMSLAQMAVYYNPLPLWATAATTATLNHATMRPGAAPAEHWVSVARRLHCSPCQVQHLRVAMQEFARLQHSEQVNLDELVSRTASLSVAVVLDSSELNRHQGHAEEAVSGTRTGADSSQNRRLVEQQPPGQAAAAATVPAAGGTAAAAVDASDPGHAGEALDRSLQRYMRIRNISVQLLNAIVINTLTKRQVAVLTLASYPYQPPHLMAVAEAAVMLEQHGGTATLDAATDQHLQAVKQDIDCHLGQRDAWLQQQHRQWLEQLQVLNQPT